MNSTQYTLRQKLVLIGLRLLVGWHFLYEGSVKLLSSHWSAKGYLLDSGGQMKSFFHWIARTDWALLTANLLTSWGLFLVGFCLLVGVYARVAKVIGVLFLCLYYLSHIPYIGAEYALPSEGSYLLVNKNLIELVALIVLYYFPTSHLIGLDRLLLTRKNTRHD